MEMEFWVCGDCGLPSRLYLEKLLERLEEPLTSAG